MWTLVLARIGLNLHSVSLLLLCLALFFSLCSCIVLGREILDGTWIRDLNVWKTDSKAQRTSWVRRLEILGLPLLITLEKLDRTYQSIRPVNGIVLAIILGLVSISESSYVLWRMTGDQNIVELHDVHVIDRLDAYSFKMAVYDPGMRTWNEATFRSCQDYIPSNEIQAGITLSLLKYAERTSDDCMELGAANLGYIIRRDSHGNPVRMPGQASAP